MAWIRTVKPGDQQGRLRKIYEDATSRHGRVAQIVQLMSINPDVLQASMDLYQATTTTPEAPLARWFRELIAVTVSRRNDCHY